MSESKTPGLSFDGKGINGSDEYRTRIATFTKDSYAEEFGPVFAVATEMLAALRKVALDPESAKTSEAVFAVLAKIEKE